MAINIKDDETDSKARELARLTGKTITDAVTDAITESLEKIKNDRSFKQKVSRARSISARFKKCCPSGITSTDHGDILYDERGLPK